METSLFKFSINRVVRKVYRLIIFSILSACYSKQEVVEGAKQVMETGRKEVFIINHNWHTGFIIPTIQIKAYLPQLIERFGDTPYLEFGWGNKNFYQAKEITAWLMVKAIFVPTESVIHVVAVPENVYQYFPNSLIERLCMSNDAYISLTTFISNSFIKNGQSEIISLKSGLYGNSQFYKGRGDFNVLNTCNKWTAKGLKSAGMDISPAVNLTAGSVMNYIKVYKQRLRPEPNKPCNLLNSAAE